MYVPLWFLIGVPLLWWLFGGRLNLAFRIWGMKRLWQRLSPAGRQLAMERFLRALCWRSESQWATPAAAPGVYRDRMSGGDVRQLLGDSPDDVERCFRDYIGRFDTESGVWAMILGRFIYETWDEELTTAWLREQA